MTASVWLMGLDAGDERALDEHLGGDARRFFVLARRVAWGLTRSDLVRGEKAGARLRA